MNSVCPICDRSRHISRRVPNKLGPRPQTNKKWYCSRCKESFDDGELVTRDPKANTDPKYGPAKKLLDADPDDWPRGDA